MIVADGVHPELMRKFAAPSLQFTQERVDLWKVSEECDVALCNANHGTTAHMLLSGKPVLSFPLYLEQQLIAGAVNKTGAGLAVNPKSAGATGETLKRLVQEASFRDAAESFAARHRDFTMAGYLERALSAVGEIAAI